VCVLFNDGLLLAEKNALSSKLSLIRLVAPELIDGVMEDPTNACALKVTATRALHPFSPPTPV